MFASWFTFEYNFILQNLDVSLQFSSRISLASKNAAYISLEKYSWIKPSSNIWGDLLIVLI